MSKSKNPKPSAFARALELFVLRPQLLSARRRYFRMKRQVAAAGDYAAPHQALNGYAMGRFWSTRSGAPVPNWRPVKDKLPKDFFVVRPLEVAARLEHTARKASRNPVNAPIE
jgi:hypothetical protein